MFNKTQGDHKPTLILDTEGVRTYAFPNDDDLKKTIYLICKDNVPVTVQPGNFIDKATSKKLYELVMENKNIAHLGWVRAMKKQKEDYNDRKSESNRRTPPKQ